MINLFACGFTYIANTGSATSKGFDLATEVALTSSLTSGLAVSYTDAYVTEDSFSPSGAIFYQKGDAIGTPPASLSPWNIAASIRYGFNLVDGAASYMRFEDIYRSKNPGSFNSDIPLDEVRMR